MDHLVVGPGVPLTDAQWARIEPLRPDRTPKRGGRWREHRQVIDAIAFTFQTGSQWVHLPERSRATRDHLRRRGIRTVIPIPAVQQAHRLQRSGWRCPATFLWSAR
ncbi:transposase [Kitasatospora sp. NPDC056446]|uniref:transposase n=1 Tax=Kitasatospora sp. NPDC056446 TaxID=3345819 RepID=UPI0036A11C60